MSILIKGMTTPKGCGECKLFDSSHAIGLFAPLGWCRVNGKEIFRVSEKANFCPLVTVPDHGRLIDADELLALVYANIALFDSTPDRLGADQKLVREWLRSLADDINDAPTIIPADKEGEG